MRVLITTGGTGGHIYPATALVECLLKENPETTVLFVGNSDRMENTIIPERGYDFIGIEAAIFNDDGNKFKALVKLYKAYKRCLTIVEDFAPDIVVGFGGYVTVPVIMASKKLGVKAIVHEQNSIAGMANKSISMIVDKIVTVYSEVNSAFPERKVVCLGNPRESTVLDFVKDAEVISEFGLDANKKTVLIVMGSLGSQSVNEKMVDILNQLKEKPYNVIYVTGKSNYDDFASKVEESATLRVLPYIDQFKVAGNCALVVSRGGATSACEYMALGLPSIIVPSPYVPNNHQYLNAKAMEENGASVILEEKDLSSATLVPLVDELINDEKKLNEMSIAATKMSHPNAALDIIDLMKEIVGGQ